MKKIFFVFILFTSQYIAFSQIRRDAVWCFGDSAKIDFNQSTPVTNRSATKGRGTATSITDTSGNILFYTHTFYLPLWATGYTRLTVVYNSDNVVMEGGDSLAGDGWYKENIIVPNPANIQQYFLFHSGITIETGLFYSIIDMTYNNGLGKVTQKNILLNNLSISDGITSVKHGNGRDWWVFFKSNFTTNNNFNSYLITPSGISAMMSQSIGNLSFSNYHPMRFNSEGTKLLVCNLPGLIEVYDFDRCTGTLSNLKAINAETFLQTDRFIDGEFSPNGNVIYLSVLDSATTDLIQYDLNAPTIAASRLMINSFGPPTDQGGLLKLAIDNKIYYSCAWSDGVNYNFPYPDSVYNNYNMNLSVINSPDSIGSACNFQPFSFYLGGARTYYGLPNNPNYDLPALPTNPCAVGLEQLQPMANDVLIYPNPASDILRVSSNQMGQWHIIIRDCTGKKVVETIGTEISVADLANGVYIAELMADGTKPIKHKVVVLK